MRKRIVCSAIWLLVFIFPMGSLAEDAGDERQGHAALSEEAPKPLQGQASPKVSGNERKTVQMTDIHDIKPPEKIHIDPTPYYYAAAVAAGLLILLGLGIFIYRWWKRRKRNTVIEIPAHEQALILLDEAEHLMEKDGKGFYFQLTAILKTYMEKRFGINAPEMTTEELLPKIEKLDIEKELRKQLKELFAGSDPVKFAGAFPVERKMERDIGFARTFVNQTKIEIESEEAA